MVDSTIIIGLLVLLTLNSISTPFVEEEQSAFFSKWYETQQELRTIDRIIFECNQILLDPERKVTIEKSFDALRVVSIEDLETLYKQREPRPQSALEKDDFKEEQEKTYAKWKLTHDAVFKKACFNKTPEKFEKIKKLEELNHWGYEFNYLSKNYTNIGQEKKSDYLKGNDTTAEFYFEESPYHKKLASGPIITIMTNIGMIFPFLISAITDSIFGSRKKESEASKIGVGFMVAGLFGMIIGMIIIGNSFWEASAPFIQNDFFQW